jgi:hypothetical protein
MTKNYGIPYVVLAIVFIVTIAFADWFPVREGNWWWFNYTVSTGGLGGSKVDSGTVVWRITQIMYGNDTYWIKVQQRRDLIRSKTTIITNPLIVKDSLFDPARSTIDTLTLTGKYGRSGLTINNDSCITLLHQQRYTADQCTLITVQILYRGNSITCITVDPLPCRKKGSTNPNCVAPKRFTLADGIGPVAFESSMSPCIMDANSREQWTLIDHHALNRWIWPDTVIAGTIATITLSTLEYPCVPDSFVKSIAVGADSILLVYMPVYNPLKDCMIWDGFPTTISYQFTAPSAGKYPVFFESRPSCYPICDVSLFTGCIDTLVVKGVSAIKEYAKHYANGTPPSLRRINGLLILYNAVNFNGKEARLLDARGRLLDRACVVEGKAIFKPKRFSIGKVILIAINNEAAWRYMIP